MGRDGRRGQWGGVGHSGTVSEPALERQHVINWIITCWRKAPIAGGLSGEDTFSSWSGSFGRAIPSEAADQLPANVREIVGDHQAWQALRPQAQEGHTRAERGRVGERQPGEPEGSVVEAEAVAKAEEQRRADRGGDEVRDAVQAGERPSEQDEDETTPAELLRHARHRGLERNRLVGREDVVGHDEVDSAAEQAGRDDTQDGPAPTRTIAWEAERQFIRTGPEDQDRQAGQRDRERLPEPVPVQARNLVVARQGDDTVEENVAETGNKPNRSGGSSPGKRRDDCDDESGDLRHQIEKFINHSSDLYTMVGLMTYWYHGCLVSSQASTASSINACTGRRSLKPIARSRSCTSCRGR